MIRLTILNWVNVRSEQLPLDIAELSYMVLSDYCKAKANQKESDTS